jgi:hypothetical protein
MRREKGDGFDKGDVTLVHTSQNIQILTRVREINLKTFVITTKKKVIGQKNIQKEKKIKNSRNLKRKLTLQRKINMEIMTLSMQ